MRRPQAISLFAFVGLLLAVLLCAAAALAAGAPPHDAA